MTDAGRLLFVFSHVSLFKNHPDTGNHVWRTECKRVFRLTTTPSPPPLPSQRASQSEGTISFASHTEVMRRRLASEQTKKPTDVRQLHLYLQEKIFRIYERQEPSEIMGRQLFVLHWMTNALRVTNASTTRYDGEDRISLAGHET